MTTIAVFMGTRPEAIKMAPVIAALRNPGAAPGMKTIVVSTGQHREMLQQVVDLFGITVDHDLAVMQPDQTLASLTARLMTAIDELLERVKPDMALVQGDTTTVLVAALACFYRRIPIGHVEAGLRTWNIWSPFPEEANRALASKLVTLHFAPTEFGRQNLLREGVKDQQIIVTGNTVIDALQWEVRRQCEPAIRTSVHASLARELGDDWDRVPYVLITGHRRENFGEGFQQICKALTELARQFPDHRFIYPVHLNPNVQKPVRAMLGSMANVKLIPPKDYREFVAMMSRCRIVLTDSGGVQEEAPSLGKPVLVMRDTTERPEGVEAGTVRLVGTHAQTIVEQVSVLLRDADAYRKMSEAVNPYGDGKAAPRIIERIRRHLAG
jgi:UDP-N-acetylglucosamine 2-epimerase (non-hydrolysing)